MTENKNRSPAPLKICHITSVHQWLDDRIFERACRGLARKGHKVILIAQRDKNAVVDGVQIVALQERSGFRRRVFSSFEAFREALWMNADVYHFHDPDLMPWMALLKLLKGKSIIYDIHENYRVRFSYHNFPGPVKKLGEILYDLAERVSIKFYDGIVVVSDSMAELFRGYSRNMVVVRNMHDHHALDDIDEDIEKDDKPVIYSSGNQSPSRRIDKVIEAMPGILEKHPDAVLRLAGRFSSEEFKQKTLARAEELGIRDNIELLGVVPYQEHIKRTLKAHIGLVLREYDENTRIASPNRIYEYMMCGVPLIVEDMPVLRPVIEETGSGLLVDSENPDNVAEAVNRMLDNPQMLEEMSENGRRAVREKYNFDIDLEKLIDFYRKIVGRRI